MRGATRQVDGRCAKARNFNPRSSCEERLAALYARWTAYRFQSTLLMRGATLQNTGLLHDLLIISIHAPHARSDRKRCGKRILKLYFNPRSSCEERLSGRSTIWSTLVISIHAPHARSDSATSGRLSMMRYFNPRSSCEERQQNQFYGKAESPISIHAPHARSDSR